MSKLPLPIWIVTPRAVRSPPPVEPCETPGHALAFTKTEALVGFLNQRMAGDWNISLVGDSTDLLLNISDLHASGIPGLCVDAEPDGGGGTRWSLAKLINLLDQAHRRDPS